MKLPRPVWRLCAARPRRVGAACCPAGGALKDLEGMAVLADPGGDPLPAGFRSLPEAIDLASEAEPEIPKLTLGDVFLCIYTSGTTGYPKAALVRHAKFTMGGVTLGRIFGVDTDDCIYAPLPLYLGESHF